MDFTEFNLDKNLQKGIKSTGYFQCTSVQETTLKQTLQKKDVCVQSQTGTGKTAAFLVSIFQIFLEKGKDKTQKALIITPTRELAVQIEREAKHIGKYLNFKIGSFYGGVGYTEQERMLSNGTDVIIGTPGRLIDFNEQRKLDFKQIKILVIDEADRLFDMGFYPDIKRMIVDMPSPSKRITMLFSATLNTRVRNLAWKHMNNPVEIEITPENIVVENIIQELYHVGRDEKFSLLLGILNKENPNNAIIFTNMKRTAQEVCKRLEYNDIQCQFIMGDLPQSKRLKIIDKVKSGKIQILVATEVAARGLHIDDVDLVINYDLPEDSENYVHRIGRTARAGKSGKAISLACEKYVYSLEAIESLTKYKIPVLWPDNDLFMEDKSAGLHFFVERPRKAGKKKVKFSGRRKPLAGKTRRRSAEPARRRRKPGKRSEYSYYKDSGKYDNVTDDFSHDNNRADHVLAHNGILESRAERLHFFFKEIFLQKFILLFKRPANKNTESGEEEQKLKIKASKKGSLEERMEFYKKKYGINFIPGKELSEKNKSKN